MPNKNHKTHSRNKPHNQSPYQVGDIHNGRVVKSVKKVKKRNVSQPQRTYNNSNQHNSYYHDYEENDHNTKSQKKLDTKTYSNSRNKTSPRKRNNNQRHLDDDHDYPQRRRKPSQSSRKNKRKKKSIFKRFFFFVKLFAIICAAFIIYLYFNFTKIQPADDVNKNNIAHNNPLNPDMDKYTTIALFGVDSRKNSFGKGNRSDSIMVISIHKTTKELRVLSIYRDTYVYVDTHGFTKITHAYAYGGAELALSTLNTNFDLNITEFATVNFQMMANIIDELGGIELEVNSEELAAINKVLKSQNKIIDPDSPFLTATGLQVLNGSQATAYSRIRKLSGGDHKRAERQRIVINKIVEKVKSNPLKINALSNEILPKVYSNLTTTDITLLATGVPFYKIMDNKGFPFNNVDKRVNGIYYGVPVTLSSNVTEMHEFLYGTKDYKPSQTVENFSNQIR